MVQRLNAAKVGIYGSKLWKIAIFGEISNFKNLAQKLHFRMYFHLYFNQFAALRAMFQYMLRRRQHMRSYTCTCEI